MTDARLPDDILDAAAQLTDASSRSAWSLGDLMARVVDDRRRYGLGKTEARQQVANRIGLKLSTLRKREAVARFWDGAAREEFGVLSYGYFETAQRQPDPCGDLRMVLESADDHGGFQMPLNKYLTLIRERNRGALPADPATLAAKALALLRRALACETATPPMRAEWRREFAEALEGETR